MEKMNLKAYLANKGMTQRDFCKIIDCDEVHFSYVMRGKKQAGRRLAKDIKNATGGLIELPTREIKRRYENTQQQLDTENQQKKPKWVDVDMF